MYVRRDDISDILPFRQHLFQQYQRSDGFIQWWSSIHKRRIARNSHCDGQCIIKAAYQYVYEHLCDGYTRCFDFVRIIWDIVFVKAVGAGVSKSGR